MNINQLYLQYGYIQLPEKTGMSVSANNVLLGTLLSNLAYYGYIPSTEVMDFMMKSDSNQLTTFWKKLEPVLKANSGAGRNIGKYVVYKNFPKEVLDMSQSEYWIRQILMYWGVPSEILTQAEEPRDALFENVTMKVLHAADNMTAFNIFNHLLTLPNRWTEAQSIQAKTLIGVFGKNLPITIDFDAMGFKENAVMAVVFAREADVTIKLNITTATDVMRLAAGLSGGDVSLRTPVKFMKFSRPVRRWLLSLLENSKNLEDDFATRKGEWKSLMMVLHPGDYSFKRVNDAYNKLYNNEVKSFASKVDLDTMVDMDLLKTRPGEFLRRFHAVYNIFRSEAVKEFCEILPKLTTQQILKFYKYINTINSRKQLMYAPRGNWAKVKVVDNTKPMIAVQDCLVLMNEIDNVLRERLSSILPEGVALDDSAKLVKLQTNDQKLASYGRGTAFPIPDNIKFIRAASYWANSRSAYMHNVWMDNGFNMYYDNWVHADTICWNMTDCIGAAFSGDPCNSRTKDGKACQMIDLQLDTLRNNGVRYIVWNVLSYNDIAFDEVDDLFASLQWGEEAMAGDLYEPSRAQMEFKITGQNKTKFIAYIDLKERKLVYIDANFRGDVNSAYNNRDMLCEVMPAYLEYLNSLPSVYDVFRFAKPGSVPVTFSDANMDITSDKAYVFRPENPDNKFTQIDMNTILS